MKKTKKKPYRKQSKNFTRNNKTGKRKQRPQIQNRKIKGKN